MHARSLNNETVRATHSCPTTANVSAPECRSTHSSCLEDTSLLLYGGVDATATDHLTSGYTCECSDGYQGNPYVGDDGLDACQGIASSRLRSNCAASYTHTFVDLNWICKLNSFIDPINLQCSCMCLFRYRWVHFSREVPLLRWQQEYAGEFYLHVPWWLCWQRFFPKWMPRYHNADSQWWLLQPY